MSIYYFALKYTHIIETHALFIIIGPRAFLYIYSLYHKQMVQQYVYWYEIKAE